MKSENRRLLLGAAALAGKCVLLTVFNGLSVWLVLASAPGLQEPGYPRALLGLLAVLLAVNAVTLLYPYLRRRYGPACSRGWAFATAALYLLSMVLCCLFYWRMANTFFTVCVSVLLLLYIGFVTALFLTRRRRRIRTEDGAAATLDMLAMREQVQALRGTLEPRLWTALDKAYTAARTSWEFASPFGRRDLPAVLDMEADITRRMHEAAALVASLADAPSEEGAQAAAQRLLDIADRLHLREKLLLG